MMDDLKQYSSKGTVLIMVLILSAIMYLAVSTLLLITMTEIHLADFEQRSTQAFYLAESSLSKGMSELRRDYNFSGRGPIPFKGDRGSFAVIVTRKSDSLYHLILTGTGVISGLKAATTRTVEREIVIKPFVLFAQKQILLSGLGDIDITGNIHSNAKVTIGENAKVEGMISSPDPEDEETIRKEPQISFPELSSENYVPRYTYNGRLYNAQPLLFTSFDLYKNEELEPPASQLNLYHDDYEAQDPDPNPARIFYLNEESIINDEENETLTAFHVQGTVVIRSEEAIALKGLINIDAMRNEDEEGVEFFPALLKNNASKLEITLVSFDNIEPFLDINDLEISKIPQESNIQGLVYSAGDIEVSLTEDPEAEELENVTVLGSILGDNISINNENTASSIIIQYVPHIMTKSPPGLQLVEYRDWREVIN